MISPIATLEDVGRDLETSGQLLGNFYMPWDAEDNRPLATLKDVLDSQQRALTALMRIVEQEQAYRRGTSARMDSADFRE